MGSLSLSPEEFRDFSGRVSDLLAEYLRDLPGRPAMPNTSGLETSLAFGGPAPEQGLGFAALEGLNDVLAHSRPTGPRFFGYVLGSGDPIAACGDLVAGVLNQNVTAWRSAPAGTAIEKTVVRWLATALGCAEFSGSLCGGGSAANLMGLAMAREAHAPANELGTQNAKVVVYTSTEGHMSIGKAVALLGIGRQQLRLVPVDEQFRMQPAALAALIASDRQAGFTPIAVVASAGTTATGAIDPLAEIAAIARANDLWLHVDGAFGGFAGLASPEKIRGIELADSIALDPHKWLYQPLSCGCLLYRAPEAAQRAFSNSADYAKVLSQDPLEGFAFFEESLELSRSFRALKIWLSLRYHGLDAFRRRVATDLDLARSLALAIQNHRELELLAPVELSAVCFRHRGLPGMSDATLNRFNAELLQRIIARRRVYFSNATLRGDFALRACITNHRAGEAEILLVVDETLAAGEELLRQWRPSLPPSRPSQPSPRMPDRPYWSYPPPR